MNKRLPPYLFPSVSWFLQGMKWGKIEVAIGGNFEKQTSRTRFAIAGPNNIQVLSVPVAHGSGKALSSMEISGQNPWVKEHLRAIATAYGSAPFYEFYDYRALSILSPDQTSLQTLIKESITRLHAQLQCPVPLLFVDDWECVEPEMPVKPYPQVFDDRHGFRPQVSALDLLFNLGPEAVDYLDEAAGA